MSVFYALLKGNGGGCGYTIGCNVTWKRLKALTLDAAKEEALFPDGRGEASIVVGEELRVDEITILEVASETNLREEIAAVRMDDRTAKEQATRAAKMREFERLKKELGQ